MSQQTNDEVKPSDAVAAVSDAPTSSAPAADAVAGSAAAKETNSAADGKNRGQPHIFLVLHSGASTIKDPKETKEKQQRKERAAVCKEIAQCQKLLHEHAGILAQVQMIHQSVRVARRPDGQSLGEKILSDSDRVLDNAFVAFTIAQTLLVGQMDHILQSTRLSDAAAPTIGAAGGAAAVTSAAAPATTAPPAAGLDDLENVWREAVLEGEWKVIKATTL